MVRLTNDGFVPTPTATTAGRHELDRWAEDLPDDFLMCRDLGHVWRSYTARLTGESTYERTMQCERCDTLRHQECSASGAVLGNSYSYESGYLAPRNSGRLTSADRDGLRLSSLMRVIEHQHHVDELAKRRKGA